MDWKTLGAVLAAGRIAYGAGLVAAPTTAIRPWIGTAGGDERTRAVVRGFGMRDLALGAGALAAITREPGRAQWWFAAQASSDTVDALATLAAGDALAPRTRAIVCGVALGSATVNWIVAAGGERSA